VSLFYTLLLLLLLLFLLLFNLIQDNIVPRHWFHWSRLTTIQQTAHVTAIQFRGVLGCCKQLVPLTVKAHLHVKVDQMWGGIFMQISLWDS